MNILLVDDLPAKLLSYESILAELGETLLTANSAREALALLLRHDVAVILIDVCMPELDGFELAQMIREHPRYQRTPIIFVSAIQVTDLDRLRGYEQGAVDYVPVPVAPELLRAKVRVFVDLYRKTRQLEEFNAALEQRVDERTAELAEANRRLEQQNLELERRVEERTRERELALERVHQMQKLESLGQLTGGVAHDFNNLLMAILGNLEMLGSRLPPNDVRSRQLLDGAILGAERGANLTKRMLAFARQQKLQPVAIRLDQLIEDMMELIARSLGPEHQIQTEFQPNIALTSIDPNQFELALLNLMLNARDAMADGGAIRIVARNTRLDPSEFAGAGDRDYVSISVIDVGVGMEEATAKRATEPFFTTKPPGKGTGLGLSTVEGLVSQSGGFMRIRSAVGSGTTVDLYFPSLAQRPATEESSARALGVVVSPRSRVLLVDDDSLVNASMTVMLEDLGHDVVSAMSASEGLQLLQQGKMFDCVLTDHAMPGMTGVELVMEIRRRWPELPVILTTGYADPGKFEGFDVVRLLKPYRSSTLAEALSRALSQRKLREIR